jgi:acid phosphatase
VVKNLASAPCSFYNPDAQRRKTPMNFRTPFLAAALLLSACAAAPANLGEYKTNLFAYEKSGAYMRDVAALDQSAADYIVARAPQVKRPALVLDIDETSLSNWPELAANDLAFRMDGPCAHLPKGPCGLKAFQQRADAEALPPTLALFRTAKARNIAVFFITGRDETLRKATEKNLRRAGYDSWAELVMRPAGTATPSAADYKAPQRARIESMGYTILATVGDQPSDLAGGHAERGFLVPNPFYRIP